LVVGKKGAKLQESAAGGTEKDSCKIQLPRDRKDGLPIRSFICKGASMDFLTTMLPNIAPAYVDLPVVNFTELAGRYDFTLDWTPRGAGGGRGAAAGGDVPAAPDPEGLTMFDAVQN